MIEDRENDWQNLQASARQMLENPRLLPEDRQVKHFEQTLHLWISPTFTPEKHWVFYAPQRQLDPPPKPVVRQIIWQRDLDFQRSKNSPEDFRTEPTFEIGTIEIEREYYSKIRAELAEIRVPPFIEAEMNGRDGEIFGVETLDLFYRARLVWWSEYPEKWKEPAAWFGKVRRFLEEHFK